MAPVFEGWEPNADGSFSMVFGYFNRNWEGELDVPTGPNNLIEPGATDQGQPTRFYPRRTRFSFRVRVPKDFGNKEVVWTVTVNGKTEKAFATLRPDYMMNRGVFEANNGLAQSGPENVPPTLTVDGERHRRVKVGTPVTLTAVVSDDGRPAARPMPPPTIKSNGIIPQAAMGLRFSWLIYRGAGTVSFDPPQFDAWENDRDGRDSPFSRGWSAPPAPRGGRWVVAATFGDPGTYVLRALAHDGALWSESDMTFVVER